MSPVAVAPGLVLVTAAEAGLPPFRGGHARKTEYVQHYSTGEELGRTDLLQWWRQIHAYHVGHNGWDYLGYNFGVGLGATPDEAVILEGRGWDGVGAHTPGHNHAGMGVCFLGDDDPGQDASPGARRAMRWLWEEGGRRNGNVELARLTHRQTKPTSCPGDELHAWVTDGMIVAGAPTHPAPPAPAPLTPAGRLAMDPSGNRGYVLDSWGGIHPLGTAVPIRHGGGYWPGKDLARAIAIIPSGWDIGAGYLLDAWGGVHAFNGAPALRWPGDAPYWPGWDIARDLVLLADPEPSGYLLDGKGGRHPFGNAPDLPGPYWP